MFIQLWYIQNPSRGRSHLRTNRSCTSVNHSHMKSVLLPNQIFLHPFLKIALHRLKSATLVFCGYIVIKLIKLAHIITFSPTIMPNFNCVVKIYCSALS